jgi:hypothetical protein
MGLNFDFQVWQLDFKSVVNSDGISVEKCVLSLELFVTNYSGKKYMEENTTPNATSF